MQDLNPATPQHGDQSWAHNSTSSCGNVDDWWLLGEGDIVFSATVVPGKEAILQWKTLPSRIYGQYKLVLIGTKRAKCWMSRRRRYLGRIRGQEWI